MSSIIIIYPVSNGKNGQQCKQSLLVYWIDSGRTFLILSF